MSKQVYPTLRCTLINAYWNVISNLYTFMSYHGAKVAESSTHCKALEHYSGKLVKIIWKMLTDNVKINSSRRSVPTSIGIKKAY